MDMRERIESLAPWHYDVEVAPGIRTGSGQDTVVAPEQRFHRVFGALYPGGLQGRSVVDCGCNCGAHLVWAKEFGAGRCFGFDGREHWIAQGRFLAETRGVDIEFEVMDLYDFDHGDFDIALFQGIFYHLPDPVTGLKLIADHTRELLILNTATRNDEPDGRLVLVEENTENPLHGIHGVAWYPSGPKVFERLFPWLGFPFTHLGYSSTDVAGQPSDVGRLEMFAARSEDLLRPLR